jgi:hypothetical protein
MTKEPDMMHPLAGVFLVTEANYRRERAIEAFRPFRRNRNQEPDTIDSPAVVLPRQRAAATEATKEQVDHQHAA